MFDHVSIRASDREASERFYDTVLRTLGVAEAHSGELYAEWDDFSLAAASADGAPGPRPQYGDDYYGAFLLDPDGNSAEVVNHNRPAAE